MKRLRLRSWVKLSIVFIILMTIFGIYDRNEINKCINSGHSQTYCEKGLR